MFVVAADHEVAGQADRGEVKPRALRDQQVDDGKGDRDALAPDQDLVEVAVERVGVMVGVAAQAVFVEQDAVQHAALLAGGGRLGDQLPAAGGHRVQLRAAGADVDVGIDGAAEQQRPRLQFVVERADEAAELGDRVEKFSSRRYEAAWRASTRLGWLVK